MTCCGNRCWDRFCYALLHGVVFCGVAVTTFLHGVQNRVGTINRNVLNTLIVFCFFLQLERSCDEALDMEDKLKPIKTGAPARSRERPLYRQRAKFLT